MIYSESHSTRQFQDSFAMMYPEFRDDNTKGQITKNITFVTTEACNLCCTYCYEHHKTNSFMTIETAKKAVDALFDKEKMNGYVTDYHKGAIIEFIGGEPLLNMDVVEFVCDYFLYKAYELNHPWYKYYMFSVTTNGTLMETERVKRWLRKHRNRISISITIDGDKQLHDSCRVFHDGSGSYDVVVKAVKNAIKEFGLNSTKVTFAPENITKINTAIPHLFDLGLVEINANCVYENVWTDEHPPIFFRELIKLADYMIDNEIYKTAMCSIFDSTIGQFVPKENNANWCGGDGSMLAISTDGRFFPCIRYMKYSLSKEREEMVIGDLDNGIEAKDKNRWLLQLCDITRSSQSTDECMNCKVGSGCSWCTAFNYDTFGTPNKRATFICKMHKARVAANYYYWNKLYKKEHVNKQFKLNLTQEELLFITGGNLDVFKDIEKN